MKKSQGFTIVEVLVVILIIAALTATITQVSRSMIAKARSVECLANLRIIGVAIESYLQEHNQTMPDLVAGRASKSEDSPVLEVVLAPYIEKKEVFHCPADNSIYEQSGSSYMWNTTQSKRNRNALIFFDYRDDPIKTPLVFDKENWHGELNGSNILYADYSATKELRFTTSTPTP